MYTYICYTFSVPYTGPESGLYMAIVWGARRFFSSTYAYGHNILYTYTDKYTCGPESGPSVQHAWLLLFIFVHMHMHMPACICMHAKMDRNPVQVELHLKLILFVFVDVILGCMRMSMGGNEPESGP